ncbi:eukaryotic translation initiation factor 2-alpha kinase-like isoform X4 [Dreissena polymorpha]|nr:eukaryotic translation initiation factor 2-alpha kinase-like isoform X2 [Dreissena polymorpha]XP_052275407.1 eukaryotic translation initiation factor 2-alpha kinase-like isoform X3 [Dreissena polymorpha]XP_052275408.1 eukaryotic translation initiation factor 2-alpha kinase-like isoform X4 [Dreissena polymorpha]
MVGPGVVSNGLHADSFTGFPGPSASFFGGPDPFSAWFGSRSPQQMLQTPSSTQKHLASTATPQAPVAGETFLSRFCEDFILIKVLGKGAFGVVLEVEKRLDLRRYAVKRIKLKGKDAETTVMPEVHALSRLDHPGIVRYFNTWKETPPLGWQEEQDSHVEGLRSLTCTDDYPTETASFERQSDDETSNKQPTANTAPPRNPQFADLQNFGANNFVVCDVREHDKASVFDSYGWSTDERSSFGTASRDANDNDDDNEEGKDYKWQEDKDDDEDDDGIVFESSEASRKRKTEEVKKKAENNNDDTTEGGNSMDRRAHDLDRQDQRLQQLGIKQPSLPVPPTFLYIQTELCKTETLKDWLDKTKNRFPDVISKILREITSSLAYIHDKQYIHRDLKPANIFFAFDNSVKLGDFGLAKIMAEDHLGSSDAGRVAQSLTSGVGTFFYMSPEQVCETRTDVLVQNRYVRREQMC